MTSLMMITLLWMKLELHLSDGHHSLHETLPSSAKNSHWTGQHYIKFEVKYKKYLYKWNFCGTLRIHSKCQRKGWQNIHHTKLFLIHCLSLFNIIVAPETRFYSGIICSLSTSFSSSTWGLVGVDDGACFFLIPETMSSIRRSIHADSIAVLNVCTLTL